MRAVVPVMLSLTACASVSLRGSTYEGDGLSFRVGEVPSGWTRLEATPPARLAFRDDTHGATIVMSARCGSDGDDVPLLALTNHLFLTFTDREVVQQSIETLDRREALHTVLYAKLDGVPKAFDVYVMKKDGCVYDFVQIGHPASFEAARPGFERFVAGFRTLDRGEP
jgi:hypothetical protein